MKYKNINEAEINYDKDGKMICNICGVSRDLLPMHIKHNHKITADEYKLLFNIPMSMGLVSKGYYKRMSEKAKELYKREDIKETLRKGREKQLNNKDYNHRKSTYNTIVKKKQMRITRATCDLTNLNIVNNKKQRHSHDRAEKLFIDFYKTGEESFKDFLTKKGLRGSYDRLIILRKKYNLTRKQYQLNNNA